MIYLNARFLDQPVTGIQRFAENIAAELLTIRDDVRLIAPHDVQPRHDGPLAGHPVVHVRGGAGLAWEQVTLPRFLKRRGSPLLLGLASTNPRSYTPQISTHHDVTYVRYPESFSTAFRAAYRAVVPGMLASSTAIITVSNFSRADIADHYGIPEDRFVVVGNAPTRLAPTSAAASVDRTSASPYFLAVSSPNVHKNFARLLWAFETFRETTRSPTELLVVGAQPRVFASTDLAADAPDGVHFLGRVSDSDLAALYQNARAFIFPSLHEGFGIPPVEAQAAGVPVASSASACMPEVLGDSALYFDPRSIDDIARALERMDSDPTLREQLTRAGKMNADRYSWQDSARRISACIDAALTAGKG